jgi:hypothetical protein
MSARISLYVAGGPKRPIGPPYHADQIAPPKHRKQTGAKFYLKLDLVLPRIVDAFSKQKWDETMPGIKSTLGSLVLLSSAQLAITSSYGRDYRLCIGEFDEKCPVSHNVFAGCGTDPDTVADNTCAVTVQGQKKFLPHRLIHQGSHDGNRCGYEWYQIECIEN